MTSSTPKKYLWRECLDIEMMEPSWPHTLNTCDKAAVEDIHRMYCIDRTDTIVYCESPTKFQIAKNSRYINKKGAIFWKVSQRLTIDLDKLQIRDIRISANDKRVIRDCTYSLQTYNTYLVPLITDIVGAAEVEKFKTRYGTPSPTDRFKSAWRGENVKEVLKKAKLPNSKSVVREFNALLQRDAIDLGRRGPWKTLPDLTLLSFIWYVIQDVNKFVECLRLWRTRAMSVATDVKLNKHMFRTFYKKLDKNQKIQFCDSLIRRAFMLPDTLEMIHQGSYDINTLDILDKTLRGVHNHLAAIARGEAEKDIKYFKDIKYKRISYLHHVTIPERSLQLEYPRDQSDLLRYGSNHINCVGSYAGKVYRGESIILGVYRDSKHLYTAEIDVRTRELVQLRGYDNCEAQKDDELALSAYIADACNKHNLQPSDVRVSIK